MAWVKTPSTLDFSSSVRSSWVTADLYRRMTKAGPGRMPVEFEEALGRVVVSAFAAGGRPNAIAANAAIANAAFRIELSMSNSSNESLYPVNVGRKRIFRKS